MIPPRRVLKTEEPIPSGGAGWGDWVLSRKRCLYRHFDLHQVPERKRLSALELNVDGWSPYPRYGSYVLWRDHHALVWLWELREGETESPGPFSRVLPESVLIAPPVSPAPLCRLVMLAEGCEGQAWQHGVLKLSRWWPRVPEAREWVLFQRASSMASNPETLRAEKIPLSSRPWGRPKIRLWVELQRHEALWVTAIFATLLAVVVVQGAGLLHWTGALGVGQRRLVAVTAQARPLLQARRQALFAQARIVELSKQLKTPVQSALLYGVSKHLAPGVRMVSWTYQNHSLQFTLRASKALDPSYYVKIFQTLPNLENVGLGANTSSNELKLTAQVAVPGAAADGKSP